MRGMILIAGLTAAAASPGNAEIVFQRLGTPDGNIKIHDREFPESPGFGETSSFQERTDGFRVETDSRTGDVITLAGTARLVSEFEVRLGGNWLLSSQSAKADVTLTLYALGVGGVPGAEIWSGTVAGVLFPGGSTGMREVPVLFNPNVVVPGTLAFAVAFPAVSGEETGFGVNYSITDPTVGSSAPGIVLQDSATLSWRHAGKSENVQAKVTAIPASGTLALFLAAGALANRRLRAPQLNSRA